MRRGFTFFDIAFTMLLLAVVGMIAVPGALDRLRLKDEVTAIKALQWIAAAQEYFRVNLGRDADGDGVGEFGFLDDLVRTAPRNEKWGDCPFDGDTGFTSSRLPGFQIAVFLPGAKGEPLDATFARRVETDFAEKTFAAMAWPTEAGRTGYRAYYVNHDLIVLENINEDRSMTGSAPPTLPVHVLASRNPDSGSILLPTAPPNRWTVFLRREQDDRLELRGVRTAPSR